MTNKKIERMIYISKNYKIPEKLEKLLLGERKQFTLDTSVLINDEDCLFKFEENEIIIPSIVWEELNDIKDQRDFSLGYVVRRTLRLLEELSEIRPLRIGVKLKELPSTSVHYEKTRNLETLIRIDYSIHNEEIDQSFTMNKRDYHILACAKNNDAILISDDVGFTCIARDWITAERYRADEIEKKEIYKGYRIIEVEPMFIDDYYSEEVVDDRWGLYPNEFAIFQNKYDEKSKVVGIKKKQGIILCNFDKDLNFSRVNVKPINLEQRMMFYLLQDPDIKCVSVTGISGKGKSLLTCAYALAEIEKGNFGGFLYSKSIMPVDGSEYMGFNKGTEDEKFHTHVKPLYSCIEYLYRDEIYGRQGKKSKMNITLNEKVAELFESEALGLLPLANIRGMNIYNKIVMFDEAQNSKKHLMKSLVSRLTDESKLIVTGDIEQIDDANLNLYNNGLSHLIEKGKNFEFIGHITLDIDNSNSKRGKLSTFGAKVL